MGRQGIVLKTEKKTMIVMTREGEFLELPLPGVIPAPGDTVELDEPAVSRSFPKLALVAGLLVLVLVASLVSPWLTSRSVAAVTFDLPVALELGVDAENRVTEVKAKDAAAQSLADNLELKGQDIYLAANKIVNAACNTFTGENDGEPAFVVTVMPVKNRGQMKLDRLKLREHLLTELEQHQFEGYLIVQHSNEDLRKKAEAANLPVAKYLVWERSNLISKEEINLEEWRTLPTEALINPDETVMERRFPGMWCRVGKQQGSMKATPPENTGEGFPPAPGETQEAVPGRDSGPGFPKGTDIHNRWKEMNRGLR